jgi:hypothetical protein
MKTLKLFCTLLLLLGSGKVLAGGMDGKNLPLVFDPQTKKYFIGGHTKFTLKPGDSSGLIDRIEIAVDGGEYHPYDQAIEFKAEGKHTLKFRAVNPVNNWSPVQFVEVFVDMNAPTTEAKFTEDHYFRDQSGLYLGLNSSIILTAQDNLSGVDLVEYSWDSVHFNTYSRPVTVEKMGHQTLYYRSTDRVGNVEVTKKLDFTADGNPPMSELKFGNNGRTSIMNGTTYVSDSVAFEVHATDDISKVKQTWVEIDNKAQIYIKPIYFLGEGRHTITYWSVDNVGNKENPKSVSVYTVSTPPHTTITSVGKSVNMGGINYANPGFQVQLSVQDNVAGTDHIEVKMDNEPEFHQYVGALNFRSSGLHNVSYRSVDRTGNVEPAKTYAVHIIDTLPETKMSMAQPLITREGVSYSPAPNIVTLSVSDLPGVGIDRTLYSLNDGAWTPYTGPITVNGDQPTYKISYKSVDRLGNEEQVKSTVLHILRSMPVVDLFVNDGHSSEEQVRTNYLDQGVKNDDSRTPSSQPAYTQEPAQAAPQASGSQVSTDEEDAKPKKKKKHKSN